MRWQSQDSSLNKHKGPGQTGLRKPPESKGQHPPEVSPDSGMRQPLPGAAALGLGSEQVWGQSLGSVKHCWRRGKTYWWSLRKRKATLIVSFYWCLPVSWIHSDPCSQQFRLPLIASRQSSLGTVMEQPSVNAPLPSEEVFVGLAVWDVLEGQLSHQQLIERRLHARSTFSLYALPAIISEGWAVRSPAWCFFSRIDRVLSRGLTAGRFFLPSLKWAGSCEAPGSSGQTRPWKGSSVENTIVFQKREGLQREDGQGQGPTEALLTHKGQKILHLAFIKW